MIDEVGQVQAAADGQQLHVAFIDLDGFKAINDRFGHDAGDRFLIEMAPRLVAGCRADDLVACYGGQRGSSPPRRTSTTGTPSCSSAMRRCTSASRRGAGAPRRLLPCQGGDIRSVTPGE
ncbi:GGDEF domain-containing protein [Halomonas sp. MA07-2]|uniref:GGDEF domain-containing protein n=1 Tax=Halomonas sp. MA07-2 TaxID=3440841 RepID=UPI003EED1FF3